MAKEKDSEKILAEAKKNLERELTATAKNRARYREDMAFNYVEQWGDVDRKNRGNNPCLTINRQPAFINQVVNDFRSNHPRIKVRPSDSKSDVIVADIMEGLIRNIEYLSSADTVYATGYKSAVGGGLGAWRVLTRYVDDKSFDQEIYLQRVSNPLSVHIDPDCIEADRSDARWGMVTEWLNKDVFAETWPDAADTDFSDPSCASWVMDDRVQVAEYWKREPVKGRVVLLSDNTVMPKSDATDDVLQPAIIRQADGTELMRPARTIIKERDNVTYKVTMYKLSGAGILEGATEWAGQYIPIIHVTGEETDVNGETYYFGLTHWAQDSQRMYNYQRSAACIFLAQTPKAPYLVTPEQLEGHESQWSSANITASPYLLYNNVPGQPTPQRIMPAQPPTGLFADMQISSDEMKATTGIYDASLGARSNETSGRAIMARDAQGNIATFSFRDNIDRAIAYTGKILTDLIPKLYDAPRIIRIRNSDDSDKVVLINKELTPEELKEYGMDANKKKGHTSAFYDLSTGKYDVVVDTAPSRASQRLEAADTMSRLVQAYPPLMQAAGDLVVRGMDFPGAPELAERLKKTLPPGLADESDDDNADGQKEPNPQMMAQMQQAQMQQAAQAEQSALDKGKLQVEMAKLEVEKLKVEAEMTKVEKADEDMDAKIKRVVIEILKEVHQ